MAVSDEARRARNAANQRQYRLMHPDRVKEYKKRRQDDPEKDTRDRSLRKARGWLQGNLYKYGLRVADFHRLSALQGDMCAICRAPAGEQRGGRLHVDHCHETGKVRGLLCGPCNTGLAQFKDSPAFLAAAIRYLNEE